MANEMARIELLEARTAIAELVYSYALNIRAGHGADCVKLFTEDAFFEVREALLCNRGVNRTRVKLTGHDAILSYLAHGTTSETRVCPMIANLIIHVNGQEANSNCVMTAFVSNGQQLIGEYQDSYRYEVGWRFSSRVFTILGEFGPSPVRDSGPQALTTAGRSRE
jgi:hypothetical protein